MKERYYMGICVQFKIKDPEQFCKTELMTFTEATIYGPITIIVLTFFPTFAYLTYCCIKFYGLKNWLSEVLDNPTYYIFSMFTNISFYESKEPDRKSTKTTAAPNKTIHCFGIKNMDEDLKRSLIDVPTLIMHKTIRNEDDTLEMRNEIDVLEVYSLEVEQIPKEPENVDSKQRSLAFSFYQSNMLYILFFLGFASCIILDVLVQFEKGGWSMESIAPITRWAVAVLLVNIGLWVDFMIGRTKRRNAVGPNIEESSWLNDLISFSSNSLVCIGLLPFFLCRKVVTR